jgi:hypothetical protein
MLISPLSSRIPVSASLMAARIQTECNQSTSSVKNEGKDIEKRQANAIMPLIIAGMGAASADDPGDGDEDGVPSEMKYYNIDWCSILTGSMTVSWIAMAACFGLALVLARIHTHKEQRKVKTSASWL